jgi:uncharacterized membrane-anchored protein
MIFIKNKAVSISIVTRVLVALIGGFILANLVAILIAYMSGGDISSGNISDNTSISPTIDSIVAGTMVSFLVWTAVVIFVFSTKSALSATLYVMSSCIVIIGIISYIYRAI